jgi:hypothetical protein
MHGENLRKFTETRARAPRARHVCGDFLPPRGTVNLRVDPSQYSSVLNFKLVRFSVIRYSSSHDWIAAARNGERVRARLPRGGCIGTRAVRRASCRRSSREPWEQVPASRPAGRQMAPKQRTLYFNDARHYYLFAFEPPMRLQVSDIYNNKINPGLLAAKFASAERPLSCPVYSMLCFDGCNAPYETNMGGSRFYRPAWLLQDAWRPIDEVAGTGVDTVVYGASRDDGLFWPSAVRRLQGPWALNPL